MIGIVDYGMGNLASVKNAFDYLAIPARIVPTAAELKQVDQIVLPGVGAFARAMQNLRATGFYDVIREQVLLRETPILGLCLGMQLLLTSSVEHGDSDGLNIVGGRVLFLGDVVRDLPVPHMGWNDVTPSAGTRLLKDHGASPNFYFVHGYYCVLDRPEDAGGRTTYGVEFDSVLERGHVFGCQFHPEKSQKDGLLLLKQFSEV